MDKRALKYPFYYSLDYFTILSTNLTFMPKRSLQPS